MTSILTNFARLIPTLPLTSLHEGEREVRVYDYADLNVRMFANMFDRRCRGYESLGYAVLLPASAPPGWPVEVPLPIEREWKQNYAASVRRLIRDGVDVPLANLFVHAAPSPSPDAEGETRVVIELDGAQHLADADACRRDRRKDALLQQHGYFVLRFLAEDAGKQLDYVLDAILVALTHRSPKNP